jgi:hypothetical protein
VIPAAQQRAELPHGEAEAALVQAHGEQPGPESGLVLGPLLSAGGPVQNHPTLTDDYAVTVPCHVQTQ